MKEYKLLTNAKEVDVNELLKNGWELHSITPLRQNNSYYADLAYHFIREWE